MLSAQFARQLRKGYVLNTRIIVLPPVSDSGNRTIQLYLAQFITSSDVYALNQVQIA